MSIAVVGSRVAVVNANMIQSSSSPFVSTASSASSASPTALPHISQIHRVSNRLHVERDDSSVKHVRSLSFDYQSSPFPGKKKEPDSTSSSQSAESFNAFVFDVDSVGKLEKIASFTQEYSDLFSVRSFRYFHL